MATVKVCVVRMGTMVRNGRMMVDVITENNVIGALYVDADRQEKFEVNECLLLKNVGIKSNEEKSTVILNVSSNTKIYSTGRFPVNETVVNDFLHSPLVSIAEAVSSPQKRKLSVTGMVTEVSPLKRGETWVRRDMVVEQNKQCIRVNFWGETSNMMEDVGVGSQVMLENFETCSFQQEPRLKAVFDSNVTTVSTPVRRSLNLTIQGMNKLSDRIELVDESGREWIGHAKDFCEVQVEDLPITIAADVEGANIIGYTVGEK